MKFQNTGQCRNCGFSFQRLNNVFLKQGWVEDRPKKMGWYWVRSYPHLDRQQLANVRVANDGKKIREYVIDLYPGKTPADLAVSCKLLLFPAPKFIWKPLGYYELQKISKQQGEKKAA